jgi:hypothetical protein
MTANGDSTSKSSALVTLSCLLGFFAQAPANACSISPKYRPPTNFELTEQADTILIVRLREQVRGAGGSDGGDLLIDADTVATLKGVNPPQHVQIGGWLSTHVFVDAEGQQARIATKPSDPLDLYRAHPGSAEGGCVRRTFDPGMLAVVFFRAGADGLTQLNPPYARSAEDVPNLDAPWIRAIRTYAAISMKPKATRRAALASALRASRVTSADGQQELLADDLERQMLRCPPIMLFGPFKGHCGKPRWAYSILNAQALSTPKAAKEPLPAIGKR